MKYLIGILILLCLFLGLSWWQQSLQFGKERDSYILNDQSLQKKIKEVRDSSGREVSVYQVTKINTDQLLQSNSSEIEQLKKDLKVAKANIKDVRTSTTVYSNTHDTLKIPINKEILNKNVGDISVPFRSDESDTFNSISGSIGLTIDTNSITIKNIYLEYDIKGGTNLTYFDKGGFLKKRQLQLLVTENNPKTTINKIQTYYIQPNKKFYQKWWFHATCGALISIFAINHL